MPSNNLGGLGVVSSLPAGLPPDQYAAYADAQRRAVLAQALMGETLSPLSQPEAAGVRGLNVQARISPIAAVSKLGEALMGRKAVDQNVQAQAALQQSINAAYAPQHLVSEGTPLQAAPQGPDAGTNAAGDSQGVAPLVQRAPGASLAQTVQGTQPTFTAPNPRNPMNLPADAVARLAQTNPDKYAEMLQGTTEWRNALAAAGGDPTAARQILMANAMKAAEVERKSGQGYTNFLTGAQGISPDPALGSSYRVNPDGSVTATPIAHAADIAADRAGAVSSAETAGRVSNTPQQYQTQGGGTTAPMLPSQAPSIAPLPGLQPHGGVGPMPLVGQQPPALPPPGAANGPQPPPSAAAGPPVAATPRPQQPAPAQPGVNAPKDYYGGITVYRSGQGLGGQGTLAAANDKAVAEAHGKTMEELGTQSVSAMNSTRNNAQALPHLANATFGEGGDMINHVRSLLAHTGLVPQDQLDKLSDTEVGGKYLTRNGTEGLLARYGRVTQGEVNLAVSKQAPNLAQQPASVLKLAIADDINNAYLQQKAQDYQGYAQRGGDPRDFERWYAGAHPIDDFTKAHGASITARDIALYKQGSGELPGAGGVSPSLPNAAQHPGATIRAPDGSFLRSDGKGWKPFTPGAAQP